MSDPGYNDKSMRQVRTRAVGQLYMGPLAAKGYDNRVMEVTMSDVEFKNSAEAQRFVDSMRRKYANKSGLCKQRRMKLASISSD
jgi:hypothetical protein